MFLLFLILFLHIHRHIEFHLFSIFTLFVHTQRRSTQQIIRADIIFIIDPYRNRYVLVHREHQMLVPLWIIVIVDHLALHGLAQLIIKHNIRIGIAQQVSFRQMIGAHCVYLNHSAVLLHPCMFRVILGCLGIVLCILRVILFRRKYRRQWLALRLGFVKRGNTLLAHTELLQANVFGFDVFRANISSGFLCRLHKRFGDVVLEHVVELEVGCLHLIHHLLRPIVQRQRANFGDMGAETAVNA
mmetsp:Transcript_38330/g.61281  ORF Transcript_38330/g.61281 Transcript_38330/m.61281 type:complete len:243 (-) Transcript_38330:485-1213(-)